MENLFGKIVNFLFVLLGAIIFFGIAVRLFNDHFSRVRSVSAIVADKNEFYQRVIQKTAAPRTEKRYVIVFNCDGKTKSFYVSEFSYNGYKKGDKGVLKYRGTKIIDFS